MTSKIASRAKTDTSGSISVNHSNILKLNDRVIINNDASRTGTVVYIGTTSFSNGEWIGIILDEPNGKNNGTVQGRSYFSCEENYGVFARRTNLTVINNLQSHESTTSLNSNSISTSAKKKADIRSPTSSVKDHPLNTSSASIKSTSNPNFADPKMNSTLQALIKEKESHIEQLISERENERCELANLNVKNEELEKELLESRQSINMLRDLVDTHEATIYTISVEKEKLMSKIEEDKKHLEDIQFQMLEDNIERTSGKDNDVHIFEMEEKLTLATNAQELAEEKYKLLKDEFETLKASTLSKKESEDFSIAELELELSTLKTSKEEMLKEKSANDKLIDNLKAEIAKLKEKIIGSDALTARETEIECLKAELCTVKEERDNLVIELKTMETLKAEVESLRTKVSLTTTTERDALSTEEVEELKKRNEELTEKLSEMTKTDTIIREEVNQVKGQLSELEAELEFTSTQLADEKRNAEETAQRTDTEFQQMVHDLRDRENDLMDALSQIKNLEKELENTKHLYEIQLKRKDEKENYLDTYQKEIDALNQEIHQLKSESHDKVTKLEEQLKTLQTTEKTIKTLSEEQSNLQLQLEETKCYLDNLRNEKESALALMRSSFILENTSTNLVPYIETIAKIHSTKEKDVIQLKHDLDELRLQLQSHEANRSAQAVQEETLENEVKRLRSKVSSLELEILESSKCKVIEKNEVDYCNAEEKKETITIDMLNQIITNLHKENESLKAKCSSNLDQANRNTTTPVKVTSDGKPKMASVKMSNRLFCDICEVFDLHDTADCPSQEDHDDENLSKGNVRKASKILLSNRLYCDNCEVFDLHDTKDCPIS